MTTTISKPRVAVLGTVEAETGVVSHGSTMPFESIHEPGAYVCRWSGHLMRIPLEGIGPERTPRVSVRGSEALMVTKIDDDPYIPVTQARLQAANQDVEVNF